MAAGLMIEIRGNDEALFGARTRAERGGDEGCRLGDRRIPAPPPPEHGGPLIAHGALDEASHFADPRRVEDDARLQEHEPGSACAAAAVRRRRPSSSSPAA